MLHRCSCARIAHIVARFLETCHSLLDVRQFQNRSSAHIYRFSKVITDWLAIASAGFILTQPVI
jgi:hypothetical protein